LNSILSKIVEHKKLEVAQAKAAVAIDDLQSKVQHAEPPRDFCAALQTTDFVDLIAEVKKASPSKGLIREDFHPLEIAKAYESGGASCLSVLTDENFFMGKLPYLVDAKNATSIPVLRKDFIIDPYQIFEARAAGADAVLLIAECLSPQQLKDFYETSTGLGMTALVELYDIANLDAVLDCGPNLVGVNNRDLNTFEVDLKHCVEVKKLIPESITFVAESGIFTREDVEFLLAHDVDAMLVGESLMRNDNIEQAVRILLGR
jgi:indole-3-glycerol phosphate synthase